MGVRPMLVAEPTPAAGDHLVQFYADEGDLVRGVDAYLSGAVQAGDVVIIIATAAHRRAFERALQRAGLDVAAARREGQVVMLDAADTLASIMSGGGLDADAFDAAIGGRVRECAANGKRIRCYGEMVALLWDAGDVLGAIELETFWNELGVELSFSLLCAYPSASVSGDHQVDALQRVCQLHSSVVPSSHDQGPDHLVAALEMEADFAPNREAPRAARRLILDALNRWECDSRELADMVMLLITELTTNAVVHVGADFTVGIRKLSEGVRLWVRDTSPCLPSVTSAGVSGEGGRGLGIVAELANQWGIDREGAGKVIWAEVNLR